MDIMPDFDLIDREYAYDGELGALYSKAQTTFRVWSPTAQRAVLKLYLSALMIIGRLELFTILILFTRNFWGRAR